MRCGARVGGERARSPGPSGAAAYGYQPADWESTIIHTPAVIPRYIAYTVAVGGGVAAALQVLLQLAYVKCVRAAALQSAWVPRLP